MFDFLVNEILPLAEIEEGTNLHSFNLERAILDSTDNGCTIGCGCCRCHSLLDFQDWCQAQTALPPSFSTLLEDYHKQELSGFDPKSSDGFIDGVTSSCHVGLTGDDCSAEFLTRGAITCQGLYDPDCEPIFLCLINESLTRSEVQAVAKELARYIKKQMEMPDRVVGSRFKSSDWRAGSEALTAMVQSKLEEAVERHPSLQDLINASGTGDDKFKLARDRILDEQDKIVWLGKNTGSFKGHQDSVRAKSQVVAYLSDVGVYSERSIRPISTTATYAEVLGQAKIVVSIENDPASGSKFRAHQPNFFSTGDPTLWVGRKQGSGGKAITLVEKALGHPADHMACTCGSPSAFEAVGSLKNIRAAKPKLELLKVYVFGLGELDQYERPPLEAIKAKN